MYYPKSQIKTNLSTNGGEYILSTTKKDYKGYYYEISNGQKYTGRTPQDKPNILLISPPQDNTSPPGSTYTNDKDEIEFPDDFNPNKITVGTDSPYSKNIIDRFIPKPNPTQPTQQDQQNGQFSRYFCKKTNENKYMEIDQDTYKKLTNKDPQIAWDLYNPVQIIWIIKGDKIQTYLSNKGSVTVIEQQRNWYGFTQWFQDKFLKYYLES